MKSFILVVTLIVVLLSFIGCQKMMEKQSVVKPQSIPKGAIIAHCPRCNVDTVLSKCPNCGTANNFGYAVPSNNVPSNIIICRSCKWPFQVLKHDKCGTRILEFKVNE